MPFPGDAMHCSSRDLARRRAMTLTELMVVVVIMLLIAVGSIPLLAPNDDQKGREAALTVITAVSRAVARAEGNGARGAGLWLEPLDPTRDGRLASRGVLDLFACQGQDDYQGDDPELQPKVFAYHAAGAAPNEAVLLFSTLTSANIRFFCEKASRITIPLGGVNEYYFRLLTPDQQQSYAAGNPRNWLLPEPYRPTTPKYPLPPEEWNIRRTGFYNEPKPLGDEPWEAHNEGPSYSGGVYLGYAQAIPPSVSPPSDSTPLFKAGQPRGALYEENGTPRKKPKEGGEDGEMVDDPAPIAIRPENLPAVDTGDTYTIRRPITRSATPPLSLPAGFGVDLAWSTCGRFLLADAAEASTRPGTGSRVGGLPGLLSNHPVCVMFSQGRDVAGLVYHHPVQIGNALQIIEERLVVTGDVYLLIGRLDRAGLPFEPNLSKDRPGANWQYPDSRWVRISRNGGGTLIADPVLGVGDVFDSQGYARRGLEAAKQ